MKELRRTILEYLVQIPRFNKDEVISIWAKLKTPIQAQELIKWLQNQTLEDLNYTKVNDKTIEIVND